MAISDFGKFRLLLISLVLGSGFVKGFSVAQLSIFLCRVIQDGHHGSHLNLELHKGIRKGRFEMSHDGDNFSLAIYLSRLLAGKLQDPWFYFFLFGAVLRLYGTETMADKSIVA